MESVQERFFKIMAPRLGYSESFIEHVYGEMALKLRIPSLKTFREFNDMNFLFKFTNCLVDCPQNYLKIKFGFFWFYNEHVKIPFKILVNV